MTYYDDIASGYKELHGEEQRVKLRLISQHVSVKESDTLLDVGAGPGFASEFFTCHITAVDPSAKLLEQNPATEKVVCKAENLPFENHSFDVLCLSAIHHCDVEKAVSEIRRVGKGVFIISVLRKAENFEKIVKILENNFKVEKTLQDNKDTIFILEG